MYQVAVGGSELIGVSKMMSPIPEGQFYFRNRLIEALFVILVRLSCINLAEMLGKYIIFVTYLTSDRYTIFSN